MEFRTREPIEYDYGQMVHTKPASTCGIPMLFSTHKRGWWQKSLAGGHPSTDEERGRDA
ncbi:MAG: hypothetical protein R3E12_20685 [Candidatus Eisenbacteria bacterium]